jgi:hypothetical protein
MDVRPVAWLFRNRRTGHLTVVQFPNAALGIFLACVVADHVVAETSTAHRIVAWSAVAALTWWAVDEIFRGVNPWRRLLGLAGCALVVTDVLRLAR